VNDLISLPLREFHRRRGAHFGTLNGSEVVANYGNIPAEHKALRESAGVLDFSFRGRLCLTGVDRTRFLHGQVTNDVKKLRIGEGCYSAITTAKGKMQGDLNIFALQDELLLDFEPGLAKTVTQRLETFIVADDVQVLDASRHYGLLSVQGVKSDNAIHALGLFPELPAKQLDSCKISDATLGDVYLMNHSRCPGTNGFELFVPSHALDAVADRLTSVASSVGGRACGWESFEIARIEAGVPRFVADMDETNIPIECGIESRAISYTKGCYIGQEVLNRIHSVGHVNRQLCGLKIETTVEKPPAHGDKLFFEGKEAGYATSATRSLLLNCVISLGYVRREFNRPGAQLTLQSSNGPMQAIVVELPFIR